MYDSLNFIVLWTHELGPDQDPVKAVDMRVSVLFAEAMLTEWLQVS